MEDAADRATDVAVSFGTHKSPRTPKVFTFLPYFDWLFPFLIGKPKSPFVVPKLFSVRYPF